MKKRISLTILAILLCLAGWSQKFEPQTLVEDNFEGSSYFDWREYSDKNIKILVQDGYLLVQSNFKDSLVLANTDLPVDPALDFVVEADIEVKSLEDKKGFGILIDEDDNLESYVFLFYENKVCRMRFGDKPINPKEDLIKLKSKQSKSVLNKITSKVEKNASESVKEVKGTLVHIRLEWNNGKYIVYANNMKVVSLKAKQIYQPRFAFIVTPKNEIKVHSMTLKQTVKD